MEYNFRHQLDYIILFYGAAFFVLAAACVIALKRKDKTLPWRWLLFFGIAHGVTEWLDLLDLLTGGEVLLTAIRFIALTLSFIYLLEFGIAGTFPRSTSLKWIPALLVALPLLGMDKGSEGIFTMSRYAFGLTGSLWASAAFFVAARRQQSMPLKTVGFLMALYAFETGLIVPAAPFFPASVINNNSFLMATSIPIQLLRAVTIYPAAMMVLYYLLRRDKAHLF